jgi:hypothetical protein
MHPYLPHLLSDITAAHCKEDLWQFSTPQSFEEEMEEIERWIEADDQYTFGDYCGLDPANFPPPQQLTHQEITTVVEAFKQMMHTYNLGIDLPENLPLEWGYSVVVDTLNKRTNIPRSGFGSIDFCTGYAPDCIFKEYCSCLEYWNALPGDDMPDITENDEELPF